MVLDFIKDVSLSLAFAVLSFFAYRRSRSLLSILIQSIVVVLVFATVVLYHSREDYSVVLSQYENLVSFIPIGFAVIGIYYCMKLAVERKWG